MELRASLALDRFIPLIGRLLPDAVRAHPANLWKAENLAVASILASIIMPAYSALYFLLGDDISALSCLAAAPAGILALVILHLARSVALSRELLVLSTFGLLLALTYRLGGAFAPTVIWIVICPLIATAAGGVRPGVTWGIFGFTAVIAIHFLDAAGVFPAPAVTNMRLLTTVSTVSLVLTFGVFVLVFYKVNAVAVLRLHQALTVIRNLAIRDDLTGVLNRRELMRLAEQEKHRTERHGAVFSLCLIDVDYFKRINDTYGHAAGDDVLKRMATRIQDEIRKIDIFGRYGGEEFLLLLLGSDGDAARQLIERIRQVVQDLEFDDLSGAPQITISAGVAEHVRGETIAQTLSRADRALYAAKDGGRNRVILDGSIYLDAGNHAEGGCVAS